VELNKLTQAQQDVVRSITLAVRPPADGVARRAVSRDAAARSGVGALVIGSDRAARANAAAAIAKELGAPLHRIDLSQVVSKYIGETEKNLSKVFAEAERAGWVLFFDEADALFGKRTGVKDSHDRYANLEVGYLLQRIEEYNGLVILATNLKASLDPAFTRRIRYIMDLPDV
jgi:SpoVK/Ycf46/Vps4 family AAA+-type ATPase